MIKASDLSCEVGLHVPLSRTKALAVRGNQPFRLGQMFEEKPSSNLRAQLHHDLLLRPAPVAPHPIEAFLDDRLHTELWTSWASLLRSYAELADTAATGTK